MPTFCFTVMFYYPNCKDKHKLVAPQTNVSEVNGIENYTIDTN